MQTFLPSKQPLTEVADIECYNTKWFEDAPPSRPPTFIHDSFIPTVSNISAQPLSSAYKWDHNNDTWNTREAITANADDNSTTSSRDKLLPVTESEEPPLMLTPEESILTQLHCKRDILSKIELIGHNLFFIQFTPVGTLRPRWFLIQCNTIENKDSSDDAVLCRFMAKHPDDDTKPDSTARWWPKFCEISWNSDGTFEYEKQILLQPNAKPDKSKILIFSCEINLDNPNIILHGPFSFLPKEPNIPVHAKIHLDNWKSPEKQCIDRDLIPPTLLHSIEKK